MADEQGYKIGDVVRLRSGGPAMTLVWVKDGEAGCKYWNDSTSAYGFEAIVFAALDLDDD